MRRFRSVFHLACVLLAAGTSRSASAQNSKPFPDDETDIRLGHVHVRWPSPESLIADLRSPDDATRLIRPENQEVRVVLDSALEPLSVPVCEKPVRGYKMTGFGKYGIQFRVPLRVVKILGGKPDADYVAYVIMPKSGKSHLEFWFGPYAWD